MTQQATFSLYADYSSAKARWRPHEIRTATREKILVEAAHEEGIAPCRCIARYLMGIVNTAGNHVKMHAVFIVEFKNPNVLEAHLPLENR